MRVKLLVFRVAFAGVLLVATAVALEAVSFGVLLFKSGTWPSRGEIRSTLLEGESLARVDRLEAADEDTPEWMREHVLHPFVGYVRNHTLPRHVFNDNVVASTVNEYGFFGEVPPTTKEEGTAAVAITGGSAAVELYLYGRDVLAEELGKIPAFANRKIEVYLLALGGMKQPQQLMALSYFLSMGSRFDVVVNLDGFNEVVLPFAENLPIKVHPYFPRGWRFYSSKMVPAERAVRFAEIAEIKETLERRRAFFSRSPWRHSNTGLVLWHMLRRSAESRQRALEDEVRAGAAGPDAALTPQETGPPFEGSFERVFPYSVEMWARSSELMRDLCDANGIAYFHFLQPNQYVPGSKVLTEWERENAFAGPGPYRFAAEKGYPLLIDEGRALRARGVSFRDLTRLFADEEGTIYKDDCCHYNERGNAILARAIAGEIGRGRRVDDRDGR